MSFTARVRNRRAEARARRSVRRVLVGTTTGIATPEMRHELQVIAQAQDIKLR